MDEFDPSSIDLDSELGAVEQAEDTPQQKFADVVGQRFRKVAGLSEPSPVAPENLALNQGQEMAIDNAIAKGFITPENYQQDVSQLVSDPLLQPLVAERVRQKLGLDAEEQAAAAQEAAQLAEPTVQAALQGTGLETEGANTVLAATDAIAEEAATREAAQAAEAELAAQAMEQDAALQVKAAEEDRKAKAQVVQNEQAAQAKAAKRVEEQTQAAAQNLPKESPDDGISMRQGLAILLGGLSQGLTGAKENPALTMLNQISERRMKKVEQEAAARKLDFEQKLALQKAELDQQKFALDSVSTKISNAKTLAEIGKIQAELGQAQQELAQQQQLAAIEKERGLTAEELRMLPTDVSKFYIQNPRTGNFHRGIDQERAKQAQKDIDDLSAAIRDVSRLKELNEDFGWNFFAKVFDREKVAEATALQNAVIGKLRIEIFGPGVLTDYERKIAAKVIRDPSALASIPSANKAALNAVMQKLNFGINQRLRSSGATVPPTPNEKRIEKLLKANPKLARDPQGQAKAATILIQTGNWDPEY